MRLSGRTWAYNPCKKTTFDLFCGDEYAIRFATVAVPSPMILGYTRVSTRDQTVAMQVDALRAAGCAKVLTEVASGASSDRPVLARLMEDARQGAARIDSWLLVSRCSTAPSGSQTRLPAPGPLRTVRASFPAYSSSLYEGILRHPVILLIFGVLIINMAIEMVHEKIACSIRSAVSFFHNVVNIPRRELGDGL